ncbi:MAG: ferrous iron transport protein A [Peptococcaceae bacterium]|jgi:ferrous iron transport protein A|nr:ferrous iron transport protein A [Peptococcaceae bacterium]MDR2736804.1 ferrous iron transport protein A [Gracilibacteraceae bacterium]
MQQTGILADLPQGNRGLVVDIEAGDGMRRRLQDLGLIKGTEVICLQKSPLGDPIAYYIRGTVIALRAEDSSRIQILHAAR